MKREGFKKKCLTSGNWIVDAREHIKNWYGETISNPKSNQSADWDLVELVAAAMDMAYREGKEDDDNE